MHNLIQRKLHTKFNLGIFHKRCHIVRGAVKDFVTITFNLSPITEEGQTLCDVIYGEPFDYYLLLFGCQFDVFAFVPFVKKIKHILL